MLNLCGNGGRGAVGGLKRQSNRVNLHGSEASVRTRFTRERNAMNVTEQTRTSKGKTVALAALLVASIGGYARAADMPVKAMPAQQPVPFFSANNTSVRGTSA